MEITNLQITEFAETLTLLKEVPNVRALIGEKITIINELIGIILHYYFYAHSYAIPMNRKLLLYNVFGF